MAFCSSHRERKYFPLVIRDRLAGLTVFATIGAFCLSLQMVEGVSNPISGHRFSPMLTPPQVLVPPHREEGQSLDDIIYGTSFSGSALQDFPFLKTSPVEVPRPNIFSTSSPPSPSPPSSFRSSPQIPPPSPPSSQNPPPPRTFSHNRNNFNLVQTFTPPSLAPPPSNFSLQLSSSSSISASSSAEEIKVPQTVKHRAHRKQYTKADLIAAANSLKPAGFDFNKVLVVTPTNNNLNLSNNEAIYEQVMFPLPLFDTPVYNQLRPFMEMLMKANYNLGSGSASSDNKKVLLIIPKGGGFSTNTPVGRRANGANFNPLLNSNKPQQKHQLQSSATTTTSLKSSPNSKFAILPKASGKLATTVKPKRLSQGFTTTTTTKRASKLGSFSSPSVSAATGRKPERGPDLQAAATSNKLSQRPEANSPTSTDKRSYSSKGGDNYSFSYAVKNDAYKDVKSHSESRNGDTVAGEYSMLEADGYTRVVRYTVDSDQGFKASVKRIPPS